MLCCRKMSHGSVILYDFEKINEIDRLNNDQRKTAFNIYDIFDRVKIVIIKGTKYYSVFWDSS